MSCTSVDPATNILIAEQSDTILLLKRATQRGDLNYVQDAYERGLFRTLEDVLPSSYNGATTLLHIACEHGHLNVVKWLLAQGGACLAGCDYNGNEPFLLAASSGHLPLMQWLILQPVGLYGQWECIRNRDGMSALLLCAQNGYMCAVQWLLSLRDVSAKQVDDDGLNCLHWAAATGHTTLCQWLVHIVSMDVSERSHRGMTATMWATMGGHLHTLRWLVCEASADITATDNDGLTCLLWAACSPCGLHVLQWLLRETNADIMDKDCNGFTVLLWAARVGNLQTLMWLLEDVHSAVHVNQVDSCGYTALMWAAIRGNISMVQWLVRVGNADIHITDDKGWTVYVHAGASGSLYTVEWLLVNWPHSVAFICDTMLQHFTENALRMVSMHTGFIPYPGFDSHEYPWWHTLGTVESVPPTPRWLRTRRDEIIRCMSGYMYGSVLSIVIRYSSSTVHLLL
jgi:ankyrin repeat protein